MGEAKRRKQALGKAYGDIPPVLLPGSRQFEEHRQKFNQALGQQLAQVAGSADESKDLDDEHLKTHHERINRWLEAYLKPYNPNVQHQLLGGVMDALYADLDSIRHEHDPDVGSEDLGNWLMEALALYPIFKPRLSNAQKQRYEEPLRIFYESILAEEDVMEPDELEFNQMMILLFESCFEDNEDGQW